MLKSETKFDYYDPQPNITVNNQKMNNFSGTPKK